MDRKTETSTPRRLRAPEDVGTAAGSAVPPEPDPEVVARATRRRFTAAYKLRIVEAKARLVIDVQGKVAGLLGLSFDGE